MRPTMETSGSGRQDGESESGWTISVGSFGIYYGWYNVLISLTSVMLIVGTTGYCFGLFVKPLQDELGLTRASINIGLICFQVGSSICNLMMGYLFDRYRPLTIFRVSAISFSIGLAGIGLAHSPLLMMLCMFGPIAIGAVGAGPLFGIVLISRWFVEKRGRALSIMALGTSLGGIFVLPLVTLAMQLLGWRNALIAMGGGAGALLLLLSLLIRPYPADHAAAINALPRRAGGRTGLPVRAILADRDFWLIAIPVAMLLGIDQMLLATVAPYMLDRGMSVSAAASVMSTIAGSAIAGKLLIAWIADRSDLRILLVVTAAFGAVLCAALLADLEYAGILAVSMLTGLAIGGTYPLSTALMADRFGASSVGTAIGLQMPIVSFSATGALYYVGAVHDRTGSYAAAFATFAIMALLAMGILPFVRSRPRARTPA